MKILIVILLTISTSSYSAVVKSKDAERTCSLYRVTTETTPINQGEITIFSKDVYGLSFKNMEVDFENKKVFVDPMINVIMGINRTLETGRVFISASNPDFTFLINQLNRKLYILEQVCINENHELIYAKFFEAPTLDNSFN